MILLVRREAPGAAHPKDWPTQPDPTSAMLRLPIGNAKIKAESNAQNKQDTLTIRRGTPSGYDHGIPSGVAIRASFD